MRRLFSALYFALGTSEAQNEHVRGRAVQRSEDCKKALLPFYEYDWRLASSRLPHHDDTFCLSAPGFGYLFNGAGWRGLR